MDHFVFSYAVDFSFFFVGTHSLCHFRRELHAYAENMVSIFGLVRLRNDSHERSAVQKKFLKGCGGIMLATVMGLEA